MKTTTVRLHQLFCDFAAFILCICVTGCGTTSSFDTPYATTYHALSPISMSTVGLLPSNMRYVFESEMGRFSLIQFDAEGNMTAGLFSGNTTIATATVANDYLKYRTYPVPLVLSEEKVAQAERKRNNRKTDLKVTARTPEEWAGLTEDVRARERVVFEGSVPVYVGVGVRILAEINNISGNVNFSSLPAISASATATGARGTISVGAMGITGDAIGLMIQQPVALNDATVQSALQSVGAIKAGLAAVGRAGEGNETAMAVYLRPVVMGFELAQNNTTYVTAIREFLYNSTYTLDVEPVEGQEGIFNVLVAVDASTITGARAARLRTQLAELRDRLVNLPEAEREQVVNQQLPGIEEYLKQSGRLPADLYGKPAMERVDTLMGALNADPAQRVSPSTQRGGRQR